MDRWITDTYVTLRTFIIINTAILLLYWSGISTICVLSARVLEIVALPTYTVTYSLFSATVYRISCTVSTDSQGPIVALIMPIGTNNRCVSTSIPYWRVLFPTSRSGNSYVLVMCGCIMRYPVVVPLRIIYAEMIAKELVKIFVMVVKIVTDQGSKFQSELLKKLYRLMRVLWSQRCGSMRWMERRIRQETAVPLRACSAPNILADTPHAVPGSISGFESARQC